MHDMTDLHAQLAAYKRSHLGVLAGPALRYELSRLTTPVDILAFDWRKLHEWNSVLGYAAANVALSHAARVDYAGVDRPTVYTGPERRRVARPAAPDERRLTRRTVDLRGQWGGDEIVLAVDPGHGRGLLTRLLRELITLNAAMPPAVRAAIHARTGGLIGGYAIAAVLVEGSRHALTDTMRAVDMTGILKAGAQTGTRAMSGAAGTVLGRLTTDCTNAER